MSNNFKIYKLFFLLGFVASVAFPMMSSTLLIWLKECGYNNAQTTKFALICLPHSLQFLIVPIINCYAFDSLKKRLGHFRSWLISSQLGIMLSMIAIGTTNPANSPITTAIFALSISIFQLIQEVTIYSYMLNTYNKKQYPFVISSFTTGYRLACLTSGAGAIILSEYFSWQSIYWMMSTTMIIGMIATYNMQEPTQDRDVKFNNKLSVYENFLNALLIPIKEFCKINNWFKILIFIILFKMSDSLIKTIEPLFLNEIGFSKIEIASITKTFSTISTFLGTFCAPFIILRFGALNSLTILYIIHSISHLLFILVNHSDVSSSILLITIGIEDFSSGILQTAFLVFLAELYSPNNRSMQNAYIWSIINFSRSIFGATSGTISDALPNWDLFFIIIFLLSMPVWLILINIRKNIINKKPICMYNSNI